MDPAELRKIANELRRRPVSISEFIPHLQKAADEIEAVRASWETTHNSLTAAERDNERLRKHRAQLAYLLGNASARFRTSLNPDDRQLLSEIIGLLNLISEEDKNAQV